MQYPLYPLTASLAAGGWQLAAAIEWHRDSGLDALDDETAINDAFQLGWDGTKLDEVLNSFLGEKWAVMTEICRHSSALMGGGLQEGQARLILARLDHRGMAGSPELASALAEAHFAPEISAADANEIRAKARELLAEWRAAS